MPVKTCLQTIMDNSRELYITMIISKCIVDISIICIISLIYFFSSIVLIRDVIINDEQTTFGFLKESKHASYHDELDSAWTRIDKENV